MKIARTTIVCFVVSFVVILSPMFSGQAFASLFWTSPVDTIEVENDSLLVRHVHDWREYHEKAGKPGSPISIQPIEYIEFIDKRDSSRTKRISSPTLTYLWLSPKGDFIVGLSDIEVGDRAQFVLIKPFYSSFESEVSICNYGSCLEWDEFTDRIADKKKFVWYENVKIFFQFPGYPTLEEVDDIEYVFMPDGICDAIHDGWWLRNFSGIKTSDCNEYLSIEHPSDIRNRRWFHYKDPEIRIHWDGNAVSLLDTKGRRFMIPAIRK